MDHNESAQCLFSVNTDSGSSILTFSGGSEEKISLLGTIRLFTWHT